MGFLCPECKQSFADGDQLSEHYFRRHDGAASPSSPRKTVHDAQQSQRHSTGSYEINAAKSHDSGRLSESQNRFLDELQPQLRELKEIGLAMGHALDSHNDQLSRISSKSESVADRMKHVTRTAMTLSGAPAARYQHRVALQEIDSRLFLREHGGNAVLRWITVKFSF